MSAVGLRVRGPLGLMLCALSASLLAEPGRAGADAPPERALTAPAAENGPAAADGEPIMEGKRLANELEFEAALSAFDRALESAALNHGELVEVVSERVLLHYALRAQEALREDLSWLAALAPEHHLDLRAPPELVTQWTSVRAQANGPLQIELLTELQPTRVTARAALRGTVPPQARARLVWRRAGGAWRALEASELSESLPAGESVELYAEALGLGNAVVATRYSRSEPLRITRPASALPAWTPESRQEPSRIRRKWLIASACALAAAALTTTALLVRNAHDPRPQRTAVRPGIEF